LGEVRTLIALICIALGSLTAQQSPKEESRKTTALEKLRTDLSGVMSVLKSNQERAFRKAVADDIMALAESAHQPPRTLVEEFANALTSELVPRGWPVRRLVRQLTTDIQKVLESAGTSTADFHANIDDAQTALIALGVSTSAAQGLARLLRNIGEQVRGPADMPLLLR
jgi:hypothetical protein